jgi:hypothetical protein
LDALGRREPPHRSVAESRGAHNQVVEQGRAVADQLGDVAHFVFFSVEDPNEILAIDVWKSLEGATKFFSDPGFPRAAATIYAAAPTIKVWGTTDWAQW